MASKSSTTKSTPQSKPQAKSQDSPNEVTAEGVPLPVDPDLEALEQERAELHKPGRASKADAEFIDNSPGYDKDQLAHMREYYGLRESTADVADTEAEVAEV